jgi:aryl-alcohol dehydrogenase-like predicted oxidoreductase
MLTSAWGTYRLSRLMLGTVQFGMAYGVANRTGQPEYRDVLAIVAAAVEGGVNCFDTAASYGTSEGVLGRALNELHIADRVVVITKVHPLTPAQLSDATLAARAIERSVAESRRRLRLDCLPVVLFHREPDAAYGSVLDDLRAKGWLQHAGVSCDNRPGPAAEFVAAGSASALQLPGNVLDRRHQRSGIFQHAASRGVAVFLRSVYLQGLLVMPEGDIPPVLRDVIPVRRHLARIAGEAGMNLAELAVRYMLAQKGITCVLAGVETVAHVRENLAIFERGPLPDDMLAVIDLAIPELPESLVTPRLWAPLHRER